MSNKLLVVNLFAGPGARKSTCAAGVFAELKLRGVNCELVSEFAKREVWAGNKKSFENQAYIFGNQLHKQHILDGEVDVIITDSPLLLSAIYNKEYSYHFTQVVLEAFNSFENVNYFVLRPRTYQPKGRIQTHDESKKIDVEVMDLLEHLNIPFKEIEGNKIAFQTIALDVLDLLECLGLLNNAPNKSKMDLKEGE